MGQYRTHVFVCTSGETCPTQGDVEQFVKHLRAEALKAGLKDDVRINKAGCFSQCGHGPMLVVYPDDVWYTGVKASDLQEIFESHIVRGEPVERLRYEPGVPGANKTDVGPKKEAAAPKAAPQWKRVCAAGDVPANGMKEFPVDGVGVLVVNTDEGFVACQAMCPHEAIPLEAGVHDGRTLTCLEHLWQFDLRTGAPMGDATEGLKGYPIREDNGELYVALEG